MKKSLFILVLLTISQYLTAQEPLKVKEVGIAFNNLNNFGISYKCGTENSLWRFNTLFISGNNEIKKADSSENTSNSNGFNLRIGKEFRKRITDNFDVRIGSDLSFIYSQTKNDFDDKSKANADNNSESVNYSTGINLVFGFNYTINKKIVFGAEVLPGFNYKMETYKQKNNNITTKYDISGFNYGLSNTSALLTVAYKF